MKRKWNSEDFKCWAWYQYRILQTRRHPAHRFNSFPSKAFKRAAMLYLYEQAPKEETR